MSKLLIIGASVLQLPAIKKAKELGHVVAVADYNPSAIGIPYADRYYNASTIDVEAICDVAKDFRPDGIMTLATDMPMRSIAAATTLLGLPGISMDTAVKTTDKWEMIKAFKEHDVESPWFYIIERENDWDFVRKRITSPCVLKPTDNAGSRGVILVETVQKLDEAYQYSKSQSRGGKVIVEEYMRGNEVSVEVIVYKGKVHILAITDKLTTGAPYFVEMGHSQPSRLPEKDLLKIRDLTSRAIKAVGIENGPAHVEVMQTKQGPKMIELGARMGGDCIGSDLVRLSTGYDYVRMVIETALGRFPSFEKTSAYKAAVIRFVFSQKDVDVLNYIREKKPNILKFVSDINTTTEGKVFDSSTRGGFYIAACDSLADAKEIAEK